MKVQRNILLITLLISLLGHYIFGLENMMQRKAFEYQINRQAMQIKDKQEQIELLEIMLEQQEKEELAEEHEYLGEFTITHYCDCYKCCLKEDGITFTGTQATEGRTIAVDPNVIPLGSRVIIGNKEYIAEDIGGAIKQNRIDIFKNTHTEALRAGIVQADVWIVKEVKDAL